MLNLDTYSDILDAKVLEYAIEETIPVKDLQATYDAAKILGIKFEYTTFKKQLVTLYHAFQFIKNIG